MASPRPMIVLLVLGVLLTPLAVHAAPRHGVLYARATASPSCSLPESNAAGLVILNNYYPGYWWDQSAMTVAIPAHPEATAAQLAAIHGAIATWSRVLQECFDGLITLTDVSNTGKNPHRAADIVV